MRMNTGALFEHNTNMTRNAKKYISFAAFVIGSAGLGYLSSLFSAEFMGGYAAFIKPPLSPSNVVYFLIWLFIYILMGLGAAIVYLSESRHKRIALVYFAAQFLLNFIWAFVFFSVRALLVAFAIIMISFATVAALLAHFYRISKAAGVMQLPYLFWTGFLAYLNLSIYLLNK